MGMQTYNEQNVIFDNEKEQHKAVVFDLRTLNIDVKFLTGFCTMLLIWNFILTICLILLSVQK